MRKVKVKLAIYIIFKSISVALNETTHFCPIRERREVCMRYMPLCESHHGACRDVQSDKEPRKGVGQAATLSTGEPALESRRKRTPVA